MGISIDTRRAWRTERHGEVTLIWTWVNDERALVMIPTFRKSAGWFIIEEPVACLYLDGFYMAKMALKASEVMFDVASPITARKLAKLIDHSLDHLVTMPSAPPPDKIGAVVGEMAFKVDGKLVGGEEVRAAPQVGANYG